MPLQWAFLYGPLTCSHVLLYAWFQFLRYPHLDNLIKGHTTLIKVVLRRCGREDRKNSTILNFQRMIN